MHHLRNKISYDKQFTIVTTQKKFKIIAMKNVQSIMFDLKKYRGIIFHDTEGDAKFEEKLICGLENDRNMANFD